MTEATLKLIMKYLKANSFVESYIQMQKQTKIQLQNYPKEVSFLRKILIQGQFTQAIHFLQAFQIKIEQKDLNAIKLEIYKQKFYELIDNPNQIQLKQLLEKDINNYCTQQQYNSLLQFLSLNCIQQKPGFQNWTVIKGRLNCFQYIRPFIEIFESSINHSNQQKQQNQPNLDDIIKFYYANNKQGKKITQIKQNIFNDIRSNKQQTTNQQLNKLIKPNSTQIIKQTQNDHKKFLKNNQNSGYQQDIKSQINQQSVKSVKQPSVQVKKNQTAKINNIYNKIINSNQQEYLDNKNNSVIYVNQNSNDNFTFSKNQKISKKYSKSPKIKQLAVIKDPKPIRVSRFSNNFKYLALGTLGSAIKIFDVQNIYGQTKKKPYSQINPLFQLNTIHQKSVFFIDWSKKQELKLVSCSNDHSIKISKKKQGADKFTTNLIGKHQAPVRMVKFNQNQNSVISCSQDSTVKTWDIQKLKNINTLKGHQYTVNAIKLLEKQNQQILLSSGRDHTVRLWDLRTGNCQIISDYFDSELTYIADNTDDIVVSHKNGSVSFLDKQLKLKSNIQVHTDQIRSVQGNSSQRFYITSSFDGKICILAESKTQMSKTYITHNNNDTDNVIYATFYKDLGFVSCSKLGLCNLYSFQ